MNTRLQLPSDITSAIDSLVQTISTARSVDKAGLTSALEGLVQAGVALGEQRQTAQTTLPAHQALDLEVRSSQPHGVETRGATGSCGATFDRVPRDARNTRTLAPCHLTRGHTGSHENAHGVSWTSRAKQAMTLRAEPKKGTTVNTTDLKARMARMERQMNARSTKPAPARTTARRAAGGPVDAARRAVDLATHDIPNCGWMPSQIAVGLRHLEDAGEKVLRLADTADLKAHAQKIATLRRQLVDVRNATLPGADVSALRQRDITNLAKAIEAVLKPLEEIQRSNDVFVRALADMREASLQPRRAPAQHPWAAEAHSGSAA
ncbi:hypothetical protein [Streptomyces sp. NPDC006477]|uniref:hypothetical protein n=1 Tax=Streptomyces sp. NPDC006477 TaxID=3364747 RepID=UPI00368A397F